ncbi:flavin reductase [Luteimonas sp. TWI1416]|uniref:flavin reductase n=1 Tax=unclassified Luteimonas TaxID=2629088 RepID=UPI00320A1B1A
MDCTTKELRDAFGAFMTGVTVVTTTNTAGTPLGFTANSFASVSLDPPLLLVSIANSSGNYDAFANGGHFAINVLAEGQKQVSSTFASRVDDRFGSVQWRMSEHGNPLLDGVGAWFDCTTHSVVPAGDHAILIGRIEAFASSGQAGLGYYRGGYFTPAKMAAEVIGGASVVIHAVIAHENRVLLARNGDGQWALPCVDAADRGADEALHALFERYQPGASANFVYSVYRNTESRQQFVAFLCSTPDASPREGRYIALSDVAALDIADPAVKSMLERYCRESRLKNYGVYYGNHHNGVVRDAQGQEI